MKRNGTSSERVAVEAWNMLRVAALVAALSMVLAIALFGIGALVFVILPSILAPIVLASLISNRPARQVRQEEAELLRNAPDLIGAMMMSMNLSPSLEKAVVFSASVNRNGLGRRLADVAWGVMMRTSSDMQSALLDFSSSLSRSNDGLKQALHLLVASTYEPTKEGAQRLLDKANELVLISFRDAAERYIAALSAPVTVLFSLGVLLPVMLFSVVPLLSLGTALPVGAQQAENPATPFPLGALSVLLIVVVPFSTLLYSRSVLSRNPIISMPALELRPERHGLILMAAWLALLFAMMLLDLQSRSPYLFLLAICLPPCLYLARHHRKAHQRDLESKGYEADFVTGLYQIGNRMSTGAGLERSLREAASSSQGDAFSAWADRSLMRARIGKKGLHELLMSNPELEERFPMIAGAYSTVAKCALRDPVSAGRVAVGLAKNLSDVRAQEVRIEERLRGVVDMMRATSLVFAPIVLGVTGGLFSITGSFNPQGQSSVEQVTLLTGIYVLELALVVSYFTTFLMGARKWAELGYQFGVRAPVAVLIFTLVSLCARTGFARLL